MNEKNNQEQKQISRRDVIKAGGVVALGLAYSKPFVNTVSAKPAFQDYGGDGWDKSSIAILEDDSEYTDLVSIYMESYCDGGEAVFVVCNVGDGNMTQAHDWVAYEMNGGTEVGQIASGTFGPLDSQKCTEVKVTSDGKKVRLYAAQDTGHPGSSSPRHDLTCAPNVP